MPGIEPGASYMQSMRSTTELHPRRDQRQETAFINIHTCHTSEQHLSHMC